MKFKLILLAVAATLLTGCATNKDYQLYAETQQKIAHSQALTETARYAALAEIAKTGDPGARVAAVMSLNFGAQGSNNPRVNQVAAPKTFGDTALQWTSVLLPGLTNLYGITANRQIAITQSNNATAVAKSTNETFATMNGNMATSNTAIANTGMASIVDVAKTGSNNLVSVANTGSNNLTQVTNNLIATIPELRPDVTTTTTSTSTSTTTNNCGSGTSGGTLTCP
jgi:hypothetical protein